LVYQSATSGLLDADRKHHRSDVGGTEVERELGIGPKSGASEQPKGGQTNDHAKCEGVESGRNVGSAVHWRRYAPGLRAAVCHDNRIRKTTRSGLVATASCHALPLAGYGNVDGRSRQAWRSWSRVSLARACAGRLSPAKKLADQPSGPMRVRSSQKRLASILCTAPFCAE
jgi:hypothetical protein